MAHFCLGQHPLLGPSPVHQRPRSGHRRHARRRARGGSWGAPALQGGRGCTGSWWQRRSSLWRSGWV